MKKMKLEFREDDNGCLLLTNKVPSCGTRVNGKSPYHSISYDRKKENLHRYMYRNHYGLVVIPEGYEVHHKCGNTLCGNPLHLELLRNEVHKHRTMINRFSDKRERALLVWCESAGSINIAKLARAVNITRKSAEKYLADLRSNDFVLRYLSH